MFAVVIENVDANQAIDMKNQLLKDGLMINQDFTWHYQQARWDNFSQDSVVTKHVRFSFAQEYLAVFYRLKWSS